MEKKRQFYEIYNIDIDEYENVDIGSANFSVRVNNRLHHGNIETIGALLKCTHNKLAELNGFGAKCFIEIYEYFEWLQKKAGFGKQISNFEKKFLPQSFYDNTDLIIKGDFSFLSENDGVTKLIDQYKSAQLLLGGDLAEQCINNPVYMEVLKEQLYKFGESITRVEKAISILPQDRRKKKVVNYINACSSAFTGKKDLQDKIRDANESLEEYIKANSQELQNDNSPISKFVRACAYDVNKLVANFFYEIKKNKRTYDIIKRRAAGQTLEQVGLEHTVTRERVRQIEKKVSQRFVYWAKHNSIILKIVADEDGSCVLLPSVFEIYLMEYAEIFKYLLKINEGEFHNVLYDKMLNLFVVGDESIIFKAQEYIEELPEQFNDIVLNEILENGLIERNLPKELVQRVIEENYKKTGDIYHCSRLTLGKIYADVLRTHYQDGIWVYSDAELEEFRRYVREDYGDIKLSDSNRALVGRIAAIGILCGRGIYGPKKEKYISDELANKIHEFICESETPIFLTNTLYSMFEEELINEGVHNKYHLQGILKELFGNEFVFRRDYVSKDSSLTSVYSEIVGYIERAKYPVTKQQIVEAFPGVTEIVINISVSDSDIINLFGVYIHSNKLKLNSDDIDYVKKSVEMLLDKNEFVHCKDIYEYIQRDNPTILSNNGVYQAFGIYSIIEYLFRDIMEFSRPYIGKKGTKITRTFEKLHGMVLENKIMELSDILSVARENHFQINSILEFANFCNDTHLLINDRELAELSYIGITEEIAKEIEQIIAEEVSESMYIADLSCTQNFSKLNVPWTSWLIYSVLLKWSTKLEVEVTSSTFKQAQPIVAIKGRLNVIEVSKFENGGGTDFYMPDDLENIDDLISDIILEEIEVE